MTGRSVGKKNGRAGASVRKIVIPLNAYIESSALVCVKHETWVLSLNILDFVVYVDVTVVFQVSWSDDKIT